MKSPQSSSETVESRPLILGLGSLVVTNLKSPKPPAPSTSAMAMRALKLCVHKQADRSSASFSLIRSDFNLYSFNSTILFFLDATTNSDFNRLICSDDSHKEGMTWEIDLAMLQLRLAAGLETERKPLGKQTVKMQPRRTLTAMAAPPFDLLTSLHSFSAKSATLQSGLQQSSEPEGLGGHGRIWVCDRHVMMMKN
ncbi:hypothetical protein ACFX1W_000107 [Malus domestica]